MRESPVVREIVNRAFESPENIQVGSFGGQRHGGRGERSLAIESSSCENSARQKVSDRFQTDFVPQEPSLVADGKAIHYEGHEVTRRSFQLSFVLCISALS